MRFSVGGFTWDVRPASPDRPLPSRTEALAALERCHYPATDTKHYAEAHAALSVGDYGHVIFCCEAAMEAGDRRRGL